MQQEKSLEEKLRELGYQKDTSNNNIYTINVFETSHWKQFLQYQWQTYSIEFKGQDCEQENIKVQSKEIMDYMSKLSDQDKIFNLNSGQNEYLYQTIDISQGMQCLETYIHKKTLEDKKLSVKVFLSLLQRIYKYQHDYFNIGNINPEYIYVYNDMNNGPRFLFLDTRKIYLMDTKDLKKCLYDKIIRIYIQNEYYISKGKEIGNLENIWGPYILQKSSELGNFVDTSIINEQTKYIGPILFWYNIRVLQIMEWFNILYSVFGKNIQHHKIQGQFWLITTRDESQLKDEFQFMTQQISKSISYEGDIDFIQNLFKIQDPIFYKHAKPYFHAESIGEKVKQLEKLMKQYINPPPKQNIQEEIKKIPPIQKQKKKYNIQNVRSVPKHIKSCNQIQQLWLNALKYIHDIQINDKKSYYIEIDKSEQGKQDHYQWKESIESEMDIQTLQNLFQTANLNGFHTMINALRQIAIYINYILIMQTIEVFLTEVQPCDILVFTENEIVKEIKFSNLQFAIHSQIGNFMKQNYTVIKEQGFCNKNTYNIIDFLIVKDQFLVRNLDHINDEQCRKYFVSQSIWTLLISIAQCLFSFDLNCRFDEGLQYAWEYLKKIDEKFFNLVVDKKTLDMDGFIKHCQNDKLDTNIKIYQFLKQFSNSEQRLKFSDTGDELMKEVQQIIFECLFYVQSGNQKWNEKLKVQLQNLINKLESIQKQGNIKLTSVDVSEYSDGIIEGRQKVILEKYKQYMKDQVFEKLHKKQTKYPGQFEIFPLIQKQIGNKYEIVHKNAENIKNKNFKIITLKEHVEKIQDYRGINELFMTLLYIVRFTQAIPNCDVYLLEVKPENINMTKDIISTDPDVKVQFNNLDSAFVPEMEDFMKNNFQYIQSKGISNRNQYNIIDFLFKKMNFLGQENINKYNASYCRPYLMQQFLWTLMLTISECLFKIDGSFEFSQEKNMELCKDYDAIFLNKDNQNININNFKKKFREKDKQVGQMPEIYRFLSAFVNSEDKIQTWGEGQQLMKNIKDSLFFCLWQIQSGNFDWQNMLNGTIDLLVKSLLQINNRDYFIMKKNDEKEVQVQSKPSDQKYNTLQQTNIEQQQNPQQKQMSLKTQTKALEYNGNNEIWGVPNQTQHYHQPLQQMMQPPWDMASQQSNYWVDFQEVQINTEQNNRGTTIGNTGENEQKTIQENRERTTSENTGGTASGNRGGTTSGNRGGTTSGNTGGNTGGSQPKKDFPYVLVLVIVLIMVFAIIFFYLMNRNNKKIENRSRKESKNNKIKEQRRRYKH